MDDDELGVDIEIDVDPVERCRRGLEACGIDPEREASEAVAASTPGARPR